MGVLSVHSNYNRPRGCEAQDRAQCEVQLGVPHDVGDGDIAQRLPPSPAPPPLLPPIVLIAPPPPPRPPSPPPPSDPSPTTTAHNHEHQHQHHHHHHRTLAIPQTPSPPPRVWGVGLRVWGLEFREGPIKVYASTQMRNAFCIRPMLRMLGIRPF